MTRATRGTAKQSKKRKLINEEAKENGEIDASNDDDSDVESDNKKLIKLLVKLVHNNTSANASIAEGITNGLAKNQHSQDTEKDIDKISVNAKPWRLIDFLSKISKLKRNDNYDRCWEVLTRKLDIIPEDIRQQAQSTIDVGEHIDEELWHQLMILLVYPDGLHDLDTIIKDIGDTLEAYNPSSNELSKHLERATIMWRCVKTACAWSGKTPTSAQRSYHNSAYIKGLCYAIPDKSFARMILQQERHKTKNATIATVQDYYNTAEEWLKIDNGIKKHLPKQREQTSKHRRDKDKENKFNPALHSWSNAMLQSTLNSLNSGRAASDNAIMGRLADIERSTGSLVDRMHEYYSYDGHAHQRKPTRPPMMAYTPAQFTQAQQPHHPPMGERTLHQQRQQFGQMKQQQPPQQHHGPRAQCRDFARGICERGQVCRFSHAHPGAPATPPPSDQMMPPSDRTCTRFLRGNCRFGASCKFQHTNAEVCKQCKSNGHQYGPRCPNYGGCYRCNGSHYASKCDIACSSCNAPPRSPCMINCTKKPVPLFRRGNPHNNRT